MRALETARPLKSTIHSILSASGSRISISASHARHGAIVSADRGTYCQLIVRYSDVLDWVNPFINIRIGLKEVKGERRLQKTDWVNMISSRSSLI